MSPHSDSGAPPSTSLPPLSYPDSAMREEAEIQAAQTMVNINPHAAHRQPSIPYSVAPYSSNASSTASSAPLSASTLKTADSHHSSHSEYDGQPNSAHAKQSLPSIHEALAPRPDDETIRQPPRSPEPRHHYPQRYSSPSPTRSSRAPPPQPSSYDHYGMQRQSSQYEHSSRPPHSSSPRGYAPVTAPARAPSPKEYYPPSSARTVHHYPAVPHAPPSPRSAAPPQYGPPEQSPSFAASPYVYSSRHTPATYGASTSREYVTSFPAVSTSSYGHTREPFWHGEDAHHFSRPKLDAREAQFPTAVKRQLDCYDLDALLTEIHDCSHNLMQFSEVYRTRHQTSRSGPIAGSTPSISDVHHAMKFNAQITEALDFALQKLRAAEAERVERETREAAERRQHHVEQIDGVARAKREHGEGGFAGPDTKKRRGHTRKMGAQKAAAIQGSNLRPKSSGQN
ncbi:MAG: hypothetical protein Q9159_007134 [Coniocarpon cinnabarinum]